MKCIFIYNPNSGSSKKITKKLDFIKNKLKEKYDEVDVVPTQYASHATKLAKEACGVYDCLVLAGGDGTFNEVINGLAGQEKKPIVGYLPAGTVCDMARNLGMTKNVEKCMDRILKGTVKNHDVCKINDRYFIYVACIGGYSSVSYDAKSASKKMLGRVAYAGSAILNLFRVKNVPMHVKIKVDNKTYIGKYSYIFIANTKSVGGFSLNKGAVLDDGKVDVLLIRKSFMNGLPKLAKLVALGAENAAKYDKYMKHLVVDKVSVDVDDEDIYWNLDGEKGMAGDVEIAVLKEEVKMIEFKC